MKINNSIYIVTLLVSSVFFSSSIVLLMSIYHDAIPAPRLSSSESFNEKARWFKSHKSNCDVLIVGSSMAVNNVDGLYLSEVLKRNIQNLGSFGMNLSEVSILLNKLPISCRPRQVIVPIFRNDIINKWNKTIDWNRYINYIEGEAYATSYFLNMDLIYYFSTYYKRKIHQRNGNKTYQSLNFDGSGSVMLSSENFNIDSSRWIEYQNDRVVKWSQLEGISENISTIVSSVHSFGAKVVFVKTPLTSASKEFYEKIDSSLWSYFSEIVKINGADFIDLNVRMTLGNDYFVDYAHLNEKGARAVAITLKDLDFHSR